MKLKNWLYKNKVTKVEFAEKVEVCRDTIYRWLNGTVPSRYAAKRIERVTKGEVTLKEWSKLKK